MTRTAIYSLQDNALKEQPAMEKPSKVPGDFDPNTDAWLRNHYRERWEKYNAHLATLRTFQCDETCSGKWADGSKLTEGVDFKLGKVCRTYYESCEIGSTCDKCLLVAFPLPVKSGATSAVEEAARMYPDEEWTKEKTVWPGGIRKELRHAHITCAGMYTDTIDKLKAENAELRKQLQNIKEEHDFKNKPLM